MSSGHPTGFSSSKESWTYSQAGRDEKAAAPERCELMNFGLSWTGRACAGTHVGEHHVADEQTEQDKLNDHERQVAGSTSQGEADRGHGERGSGS